MSMLVLGIETTCDETGAAVVRDGMEILTNVVATQIEDHRPYGGVVPELASRQHIERISPVVREAMRDYPIDLVAVAQGPGLVGALLVGIQTAKGIALGLNKPLIGINHIEAHLYAAFMSDPKAVKFPALGVVISGGHTALLRIDAIGKYTLISTTVDDAIGEAFDKVASMLGLPYPGGPAIEELAKRGDPTAYPFKPGRVKGKPLHFSFSGLKTNVLYTVKGQGHTKRDATILSENQLADVAASFQETALRDIVDKAQQAMADCHCILIGGGVSNNLRLRELFGDLPVVWPTPELTLDNGAMIAGLGYERYQFDGPTVDLSPKPRIQGLL